LPLQEFKMVSADNNQSFTNGPQDNRAELATRQIPIMTLSSANNPLTAPLAPPSGRSATELAAARFAIKGNAIITGGAGGLALHAGRALLEHGLSSLLLLDLASTFASSKESLSELRHDFPQSTIYEMVLDVTDASAVKVAFEEAASMLGQIDILCCFAGIVGCDHAISASSELWRKVIDVNLTGSFLCAQAAAQYMIASEKGGSILFTSSISAHHVNFPQPQAVYNVSKAGVSHLTRNLATEWAVHGIRVNCLSPGYMDTVLNAGENLKAMRDVWASRCPYGRMGDPEEVTGAVVLLCSERGGRYMTGCDLIVDGGAMAFC